MGGGIIGEEHWRVVVGEGIGGVVGEEYRN